MTADSTPPQPVVARLIELPARAAGFARRLLLRLWRTPDPWLHDTRRRRAVDRLPARIDEVLVICYGNICRSPYAAAALARELGNDGPAVTSAGFYGPDRGSPEIAVAVARGRGHDLEPHRSRLVSPEAIASADLIVVMERRHVRDLRARFDVEPRRIVYLGDFDPHRIEMRDVPDPYGGSSTVFEACFERIDRCAHRLAAAIRDSTRPAAPAD